MASCSNMTSDQKQPAGISKSDVDSVSFMMGYSFGMSLGQGDFGALNINKIADGIKAAVSGKNEINQQQFYETVNGFLEKRRAAMVEINAKEGEDFLASNAGKSGVETTESGLQYKVERNGNGVFPTSLLDTVVVNYEGCTLDGKVFDSSYERGETAEFPLGAVISGWGEGLQKIDEGGEITLWIPANLAYGERGAGSTIGPNKTLKFKVELITVKPCVEASAE